MRGLKQRSISLMMAVCMLLGLMGAGAVFAETAPLNYSLSYGSEGDFLPADWVGDTQAFTSLGGWAYNTNLTEGNNWWGRNATVIQDTNYWQDELTYTIRINESGATDQSGAVAYFFYNDSNNYYAVNFGSTAAAGIKLVKKVDGKAEETLATAPNWFQMKGHTATINHTADGIISVTYRAENSSEELPLFDSITDTTFSGGKLGFGIKNGGGWFTNITATGTIVKQDAPDEGGTTKWETFQTMDFNSPSADEIALWKNEGNGDLTIAGGVIGGSDWGPKGMMYYTGEKFNSTYKYSVDVKQNWGGGAGNWGGVLFNYQPGYKGYCLKVEGGPTGTFVLQKYIGNLWEQETTEEEEIVTLATYKDTSYLNQADIRLEITYEEGGYITVDCIKGGETTRIFDRFYDASFTNGYVGVAKQASGFAFDNIAFAHQVEVDVDLGTPVTFDATNAQLARQLGRTRISDDKAVEMYYPLCGLEFTVTDATQVELTVKKVTGESQAAYIGVYIDDSSVCKRYEVSGSYESIPIAKFTEPGTHKIRVFKACGPRFPMYMKEITAYSFVDGAEPTIAATQPKERKIEIVGDSITVGEGISEGGGDESEKSYANITANYFDADRNIVAIGGGGFLYDVNTDEFGLNTYHYYNKMACWTKDSKYDWDFSRFTPDLIVANLGTNGGADCTPEQYKDFVKQVRQSYQDTETKSIPIILALGPMNQFAWPALSEAADQLNAEGDTNIYKVQIGDGLVHGSGWHPDENEQRQTAELLIAKIKEVMPQWNYTQLTVNNVSLRDGSVEVSFNGKKQTVTTQQGTVHAALFNQQGVLVGFENTEMTFSGLSQSVDKTVTLSTSGLPGGSYYVKLFLWDEGMQPQALPTATQEFTL